MKTRRLKRRAYNLVIDYRNQRSTKSINNENKNRRNHTNHVSPHLVVVVVVDWLPDGVVVRTLKLLLMLLCSALGWIDIDINCLFSSSKESKISDLRAPI